MAARAADQRRPDEVDKFSRVHDFRVLVIDREVRKIAGDEVISFAGFGAFIETVIRFIAGNSERTKRFDEFTGLANVGEEPGNPPRLELQPGLRRTFSYSARMGRDETIRTCLFIAKSKTAAGRP